MIKINAMEKFKPHQIDVIMIETNDSEKESRVFCSKEDSCMTEYVPKVWQELTNHYQEIQPDLRLRTYIQSYWFSYTRANQEPARIIPDLCSDLIIQLSPALEILSIELCGPSTAFLFLC